MELTLNKLKEITDKATDCSEHTGGFHFKFYNKDGNECSLWMTSYKESVKPKGWFKKSYVKTTYKCQITIYGIKGKFPQIHLEIDDEVFEEAKKVYNKMSKKKYEDEVNKRLEMFDSL